MAVNKVIYAGETLIDLTSDTVTPETLAEGVTAHDSSGNLIIGTMLPGGAEAFYRTIEDSDGNEILGSDGTAIEGRIMRSGYIQTFTATIGTNWDATSTPYMQIIAVPGLMAIDSPHIDILVSDNYYIAQDELDAYELIYRIVTLDDAIEVYAVSQTEIPITIQLEVRR